MTRPPRSVLAALFAAGVLVAMGGSSEQCGGGRRAGKPGSQLRHWRKVLISLAGVDQEVNQALVSGAAPASNGDIVASGSSGLVRYLG